MAGRGFGRVPLVFGIVLALAACEDGALTGAGAGDAAARPSSRIVERDVEAPQVFQANEPGLWDGRPSLGGVWVAYPGVRNPERVIIVNEANGRSVIGALFRREREIPGPRLQVSSDAAEALGLLAGQPTPLRVTALRREETTERMPVEAEPAPDAGTAAVSAPEAISAAAIDGEAAEGRRRGLFARMQERRAARAAAGTAAAEAAGTDPDVAAPAAAAAAPPSPSPQAPAPAPAAGIAQPWIQIGIFSVEANAERAAAQMRGAGLPVVIRRQESQGKVFWRVLVGPAATAAERDAALAKVKGLGYRDAYAVRN
jgi:cell division septation protein DedD